jgi:L-2-hydroxyglutarate oxidase
MNGAAPSRVAIIGGGIVGLAVARALLLERRVVPVVLEAEAEVGAHQTGHNSGVIHSGLYYRAGSRKARDCVAGREALYDYCRQQSVDCVQRGKLVVATSPNGIEQLEQLERRGRANGLDGLRRIGAAQLGEYEPHVRAAAGLWVPQTGVVNFSKVAQALARELREAGAEIRTNARVTRVLRQSNGFVLELADGTIEAGNLINCAGLQSDRIARLCGLDPGLRIVPFRGEYYRLTPQSRHLVRNLVYPVPAPELPFLGAHFTRTVADEVEVGPNAVLALHREGYRRWSVSPRDVLSALSWGGFWRMVAGHWRYGLAEHYRSWSKRAFVSQLQKMIPAVGPGDLLRGNTGVRAQAIARNGALVDDFQIVEGQRMLHVLNAPSPAATAALTLGSHIAHRARLD